MRRLLLIGILFALGYAGCKDDPIDRPAPDAEASGAASSGSGGGSGGDSAVSGAGGSAAGAAAEGGGSRAGSGGSRAGSGGSRAGSGGSRAGGSGGAGSSGGGRGGSAGAPAAGSGGGAGSSDFFGESRCATAGLWLCEDFESGTIDAQRWKAKLTAPAIDEVHAARGKKALHISTSATSGSGLETTKIFPTPNENYWGRLFVYFTALPTSPTWAHWTIVGANPASGSAIKGELRIGGQFDGKIDRFGVGTDQGPTGDWTNLDADPKNALPVPVGSWICVEWQHDGAKDETRFFWDGVEHPSLDTTRDTKHDGNASTKFDLPTIGSVWFGFWNYDQGKAVTPNHFDTWIDEIALDDERIGCTR